MLQGLTPSTGTVGDGLDNALAKTTIALYNNRLRARGLTVRNGPISTLADLEDVTSVWCIGTTLPG